MEDDPWDDVIQVVTAAERVAWEDPGDDVKAAGAVPGEHPCDDVTATLLREADDVDWLDDVRDDVEEELSAACCFTSSTSSFSSPFDDSDADDDDDFVVPATSVSLEAGFVTTADDEEEEEEEEEDDDDDVELEDDAELLEHEDAQRLDTSAVVSSACRRASHSLTSTSTTNNESGRTCSLMTVSGDSCVIRHVGIVDTLSSRTLTVDRRARSVVKYDSRRGRVGPSSPLVTVDDVEISTEPSIGADFGREDEFVNLDRRIWTGVECAAVADCATTVRLTVSASHPPAIIQKYRILSRTSATTTLSAMLSSAKRSRHGLGISTDHHWAMHNNDTTQRRHYLLIIFVALRYQHNTSSILTPSSTETRYFVYFQSNPIYLKTSNTKSSRYVINCVVQLLLVLLFHFSSSSSRVAEGQHTRPQVDPSLLCSVLTR